jgi:hypothetical protein
VAGEDVVEVLVARHRGDREELERMFGKMYVVHVILYNYYISTTYCLSDLLT